MFKVHIGLPGLHEAVLQNSVGWDEAPEPQPYLLSVADYSANLAPFVNTRDKARTQSDGSRVAAAGFVDRLIQYPNVVVSVPQILGSMSDAHLATTLFPRADGRIARLTKLLSNHNVEFHLLLRSPFDYFFPPSDPVAPRQLAAVLDAKPSWLTVVERLRRATLGRPITVWDFERPSIMAPRLRSSVLGPDYKEPIYDEEEDFADAHQGLNKVELPDRTESSILEAICLLDDKYDSELDQLEAMPGVNLVRSPHIL